jgi:Zn-finger nucleic acid-binding protein
VDVDTCATHGTWLDAGELDALVLGYEKAIQDRKEIAALLQKPQENVYRRGVRELGKEALRSAGAALEAGAQSIVHPDSDGYCSQDDYERRHDPVFEALFGVLRKLVSKPK